MRALMVIAEMGTGGAETVVADLAGHLTDRGHEVTVASNGGFRADDLPGRGVRSLEVPLRRPGAVALARTALRLRHDVRRTPVDLVHAHNVRAAVAAHLGTRWPRRRTPLLSTVHGLPDGDYGRAAAALNRCADLVVAVSDDVADRLVGGGLDPKRLTVIENASQPVATVERDTARRALCIDQARPVVLCLARVLAPKRHDLLVEAWTSMPTDALLLVVGDGPGLADLERRVRLAGLDERVRLMGPRRDVPELLAASDLLVLPSDREGMPMAVLEAMSARVPVVATGVGGLASLGPAAIELVEPGSAAALARGMAAILGDEERAGRMTAAATELLRQRFSSPTMRSAYLRVYRALILKSGT